MDTKIPSSLSPGPDTKRSPNLRLPSPYLDPNCLRNYRPISNLPFLLKVLERIVLKQFLQHLEFHSLLEPFQSAYRKCHSTETALLRVVNDLLQASDTGHVSILSLIDLSAAFDTIDHGILINRLFWKGPRLGHLLFDLSHSICFCWS